MVNVRYSKLTAPPLTAATLAIGLFGFSSTAYSQTMTIPETDSFAIAQASSPGAAAEDRAMVFETLNVRREGAVLFVEIAAPPMNLLGPELVRDLVSLIQRAEADDALRVCLVNPACLPQGSSEGYDDRRRR
jgi:hypothetical protein